MSAAGSEHQSERIIMKLRDLPAMPRILADVLRVINDESWSISDFEEVIMRDQALAAKILRVANSASLGFSRRVNTIKDAVILLGTRQTRDIAAAMATAELFKTDKAGHIDGTRLWNHALAVSWFSRAILEAKHIWQIDHVVTAGLLHDVGIVILCQHRPAIYSDVVKMTKENRLHHEVFEKQLLGVTHSQISGKACAKWRLPAPIVQLVNHHHNDPLIFRDTKAMLVLMVADYLSQELGFCNFEETPTRDRPEAAFRGLSINQDDEDKLRARSEELKEYTDALNEVL